MGSLEQTLEVRAHAKINWALNITGRYPNGYHTLDMVMQSIELHDELRFERAEELTLFIDGRPDPDQEANLVIRSARRLLKYTGRRRGAVIHLKKNIPARAGLGGGSADGAATLRALNRLWDLQLDEATLLSLGAGLGADVPFALTGALARVRGIGEIIEPAPQAPQIPLLLVTPGGGLSTKEVFGLWDSGGYPAVDLDADALLRAILRRDLDAVDALCANALTAPALRLMPEIGGVMEALRNLGGRSVFMTGSGSTVVAAFDTLDEARRAAGKMPGAVVSLT